MPAQLLVSVRSPKEAEAALDGGARIIDVKEPQRGSLGRSDGSVIAAITQLVRHHSPGTPVSAALGEVAEWSGDPQPNGHTVPQLRFVKAGLAGLMSRPEHWQTKWHAFRRDVSTGLPQTTQWVAVSYADAVRANAPSPNQVLEEARQSGCPILLIDTFEKDDSTLFDWMTTAELTRIRQRTLNCGMKLALAGRISARHLPRLLTFAPDIVAVRGAVCEQGQRTATVSAERVRDLSEALADVCPVPAPQAV